METDSSREPQTLDAIEGGDLPPLEPMSQLKRFLHHDLVGTGFLLTAAVIAFVLANSPAQDWYHHLWEIQVGIEIGDWGFSKSLHHWVNDGLMAIFFFVVGLEIKRELVAGELATFNKAILPAVGAVGGMIVPALVYYGFTRGTDGVQGWGIPMATDIAFAAGCIAVLRKRVPPALMVFLVALAIVDDLGAVSVIAIFYTDHLDWPALILGGSLILISAALGLSGVRRSLPYVIIGHIVWFAFVRSGVHATIAGVLLAFTIPTDARYHSQLFTGRVRELLGRFTSAEGERTQGLEKPQTTGKDRLLVTGRQQDLIRAMKEECHHVEPPLQRIEYNLEPLAVFVIMPIFAFANSGLTLDFANIGDYVAQPTTLGVFFGLIVGKQIGIISACFLAVKAGVATLPAGVKWVQLWGVSFLCAIGFTMSLFIAELAFRSASPEVMHALADQAKFGIFTASILAGICGLIILRLTCREIQPQAAPGDH